MIKENINKIISEIPNNVKLIAVSKTMPVEDIEIAYNSGQRAFGENKVQEMADKYSRLPKDIEWHMIGHLQTNKVKIIVPFVSYIQSVDSIRLFEMVEKEAKKCNRPVKCLLQVYIAKEESKFGFDEKEIFELLNSGLFKNSKFITICGLMGMATLTDNRDQIKNEFHFLSNLFQKLKIQYFSASDEFKELSMGMSDDYKIAIEEGSTMIRVGTTIFGKRQYNP